MKRPMRQGGGEHILRVSIPLFAETGFDGVSMRDVAEQAGVTPAALYYHFQNKEQLYVEAVTFAFRRITATVKDALAVSSTPARQLESLVTVAAKMLVEERPLLRLMQWVKLDRSESRLRELGASAFQDLYLALYGLAVKLGPQFNPSLLAVSIASLLTSPFEANGVNQFLPGYQNLESDTPTFVRHVMKLLREGLSGSVQVGETSV